MERNDINKNSEESIFASYFTTTKSECKSGKLPNSLFLQSFIYLSHHLGHIGEAAAEYLLSGMAVGQA